jgi:hypothetical protein
MAIRVSSLGVLLASGLVICGAGCFPPESSTEDGDDAITERTPDADADVRAKSPDVAPDPAIGGVVDGGGARMDGSVPPVGRVDGDAAGVSPADDAAATVVDAGLDASPDGSPRPGEALPPLELGFEFMPAVITRNYVAVFSAELGLVDGESWRGFPLGATGSPILLWPSGHDFRLANRTVHRPLDVAVSASSCLLDERTESGGVKTTLLRCNRRRFPLETYERGEGGWLDLEVKNLKAFSASESLACVHDAAGFKCYGAKPDGRDQLEILEALQLPTLVPSPTSFKVGARIACAVHGGASGTEQLTCLGRNAVVLRQFNGRTFVRGTDFNMCLLNPDLTDMRCDFLNGLAPDLRTKLGLTAGGRIEDSYGADGARCVRVGRRVGCTPSAQGYADVVVSLPEEWDVTSAGKYKMFARFNAPSDVVSYELCFQVDNRLLCDETRPDAVRGVRATVVKAGRFEERAVASPRSSGVEWVAHASKNRLGCIDGGLLFMPGSDPRAVRRLGNARSSGCTEVVPQPGLIGGAYLLRERIPLGRLTWIEALAESSRDLPSHFEEIEFVTYQGARKSVTAPGLTRSSYAFSAGRSGSLYYVVNRPKSSQGEVTRPCSATRAHPGCPKTATFASTVYRIKPNANGTFPLGAEELYKGENVVAVSLARDEKTLFVEAAASLTFDGEAYRPVNPRVVRADIIDVDFDVRP